MHLLNCGELSYKLLILSFQHLHLLAVLVNYRIFFTQLSLQYGCSRLQLCHLFCQHSQFIFHHLEVVLSCKKLLLLTSLLSLHFDTVRAWLLLKLLDGKLVDHLVG